VKADVLAPAAVEFFTGTNHPSAARG
jgi:hypothetical protein